MAAHLLTSQSATNFYPGDESHRRSAEIQRDGAPSTQHQVSLNHGVLQNQMSSYINSEKISYEQTNSASFLPSAQSVARNNSFKNGLHQDMNSDTFHRSQRSAMGSYVYTSVGGQNEDSAAQLINPSDGYQPRRNESNMLIRNDQSQRQYDREAMDDYQPSHPNRQKNFTVHQIPKPSSVAHSTGEKNGSDVMSRDTMSINTQ